MRKSFAGVLGLSILLFSALCVQAGDLAVTVYNTNLGVIKDTRSFELSLRGRELHLELQRTSKRGRGTYPIGTGTPPPGVDLHPLDELASDGGGLLFSAED